MPTAVCGTRGSAGSGPHSRVGVTLWVTPGARVPRPHSPMKGPEPEGQFRPWAAARLGARMSPWPSGVRGRRFPLGQARGVT